MIPPSALQDIRSSLHGEALLAGAPDYDRARSIFNAMIDRRPALIARCADASDVAASVLFARREALAVSVKGGGHNVSGKAVCEGGLMIDLSRMKGCRVDPARRVAHAEPGLTLGELDRATAAHGLAVPTGIVSMTGIAGLALGGGLGWLAGKHGLACDNLLSAQVVTAEGRLVTASASENPDLYWAIRGGGGNFGVVTSFEFRLHEVGSVLGGGVAWPIERAASVLRFYRDFTRACPDELTVNAGLFVVDGVALIGLNSAWIGPAKEGEARLKPLRTFESPVAEMIRTMSFVELQGGGDGAFPDGRRHYWKGNFIRDLTDGAIETLIRFAATSPSPYSMIGLQHMHGAAARVPFDATAFAHRYPQWDCLMLSQWEDPAEDSRHIAWTRGLHAALSPWLADAVYVNDLGDDEPERVRSAYGANFDRLTAVKAKYDPENFFRGNQNIATTAP